MPIGNIARLANSSSQRVLGRPSQGRTSDLTPHGFQIFDFCEATLALPKMALERERICRIQLSIKKSVEKKLPFQTGADGAHAG
jgi:hypothetical protein